jgi:hypothetical protein
MKGKTKFKLSTAGGDEPINLNEVASDLAAEANFYVTATEELPDMTGPEVAEQLSKMLSNELVTFFLESGEYGRGFLAGVAYGIFTLEQYVDAQLADRLENNEDEFTDEEAEDMILNNLKNGLRGGGRGTDETNH